MHIFQALTILIQNKYDLAKNITNMPENKGSGKIFQNLFS